MTRTIGIYLFDQVEVLDFAGPFEIFLTASRVYQRLHPDDTPPFSVILIGQDTREIIARGGMRILPDFDLEEHPRIDILIIPGGVVDDQLQLDGLSAWIESVHEGAEIVASVCTGSFLLAEAGLLNGLCATTHWEDLTDFSDLFPHVILVDNQRWVDQGKIITSAGISAGIDMSLHIVSRLAGRDLALRTARQMDYHWSENK